MKVFDVRKGRRARPRTDFLVVHTSLTFPDQECNAKVIDGWHRQRGFDGIGYHKVILRDGTIENGRPLDEFGAHTINYNGRSVGIVLCGGYEFMPEAQLLEHEIPKKWVITRSPKGTAVVVQANYTQEQMDALASLLRELREKYKDSDGIPPAVVGHRDLSKDGRACPAFDVRKWWAAVERGRVAVPKTEW